MFTLVIFIIALSILVFVHEWGHFFAAKKSGIRVDIFSIGFGPKLIGKIFGGTEYRIAPVPFGGYVKIYGQEPFEEAEGNLEKAEQIRQDPQAFASKSFLKKMAVIVSGPALNLILCFVLMPLVFLVGRMEPKILSEKPFIIDITYDSPAARSQLQIGDLILKLNDNAVSDWDHLVKQILMHPNEEVAITYQRYGETRTKNIILTQNKNTKQPAGYLGVEPMEFFQNEPVIDKVSPDSAADRAGLKSGDKIVRLNGKAIQYWSQMVEEIQVNQANPASMVVVREGSEVELMVYPELEKASQRWLLGIAPHVDPNSFALQRYGFTEALHRGFNEAIDLFKMTFEILGRLLTGHLSVKSLGGPLAIAQAASNAAKTGLGDFIYFLGFLSMQLGILNLLPIPILDGGHVVFITIEAIRRKPISYKVKSTLMYVGMALLFGLVFLVTMNDVDNAWGLAKIVGKIKGIF